MSAYNYDPNVCLHILHEIAENIPTGISDGMFLGDTFTSDFRLGNESKEIKAEDAVDTFWHNSNVAAKMYELKDLIEKSAKAETQSGTCKNITTEMRINYLQRRKAALQKEIEKIRAESDSVKSTVSKWTKQLDSDIPQLQTVKVFESIDQSKVDDDSS